MAKKKAKKSGRKRRILWGILLLLVVGLAVLLALRWRAWFGNQPEAEYRTPEYIDRVTLTPGAHFDSERTISWRCGESLQDAWLEYTLMDGDTWRQVPAKGKLIETRAGRGCYYTASIGGLTEGIGVRYRVRTGTQISPIYQFTMPSQLDQEVRFVYLGDVQDPTGEMSRTLFGQLRDSVGEAFNPHFWTASGDQIEGPTDAYWQVWYDALGQSFSATMSQIYSTGNHEYLKRGFMRELDPRWVAQYNYPTNGPEDFLGRSYYVDFPLMRFIILDTTDINDPMAVWSHRAWLERVLRSSAQPWQVVVYHHAVESVRAGRSNTLMKYFIKPVLEDNGADLVLQGHDHGYSRISNRGEGKSLTTPLYIISSSSPKVYRNGFDEVHDRLGSGLQLYQNIRVTPEAIEYKSYRYTGELYDHLRITSGTPNKVQDLAGGIPELFLFDAFGDSKKGRAKAEQYQQEIADRKARRAS